MVKQLNLNMDIINNISYTGKWFCLNCYVKICLEWKIAPHPLRAIIVALVLRLIH